VQRRLWVLVGAAFVAGLVVGVVAFLPGNPFDAFSPRTKLLVHVENTGAVEVETRLDVRDASGRVVASTTFQAPAHASVEKTVVNLPEGAYVVRGTFTSADATASGDARVDTPRCGEGATPVATFRLNGDGSFGLSEPPSGGCRG